MKVLVDTSVWSLAFRRNGPADNPAVRKLALLLENGEDVVITGTILQEILQAFRKTATVKTVAAHLESIPMVTLDRADYEAAAALHRRCASKGVCASTVDCQIAEAAIRHECLLLTADQDFEYIARHTPLKLA